MRTRTAAGLSPGARKAQGSRNSKVTRASPGEEEGQQKSQGGHRRQGLPRPSQSGPSTSQMPRRKPRDGQGLGQGHTATWWQCQTAHPGLNIPSQSSLGTRYHPSHDSHLFFFNYPFPVLRCDALSTLTAWSSWKFSTQVLPSSFCKGNGGRERWRDLTQGPRASLFWLLSHGSTRLPPSPSTGFLSCCAGSRSLSSQPALSLLMGGATHPL